MTLPEGWTIEARPRNEDGQCSLTITDPNGRAATFFVGADLIAGQVVEALAATPYRDVSH